MGIVNEPFGLQQKLECQKLLHFFPKGKSCGKDHFKRTKSI